MVEDLDPGGDFWGVAGVCLGLGTLTVSREDSFIGHMIDGNNINCLILLRWVADDVDTVRYEWPVEVLKY